METVSIAVADGYEPLPLRQAVIKMLEPLGGISAFISDGDRVLLKPNMLLAKGSEYAVTTHPVLVQVVAELVHEAGGLVSIGDSPGFGSFKHVAEKCGIAKAARNSGGTLVEFSDAVELRGSGTFRSIHLARAYYEADKIINLPKLKTHEMMTMTCAVKNLFGAVIGSEKAVWHMKAGSSKQLFAHLLLEIYQLKKPALTIVDAITAMEGNGPGNGEPIKRGLLISGDNAVAVDVIAARLAGIPANLLPVELEAVHMGIFGALIENIKLTGTSFEGIPEMRFKLPDGMDVQFGLPSFLTKALKNHLTSYPEANPEKCLLCAVCSDACPPAAITIQNSVLSVDKARCIRCWCCRELCQYEAMEVRQGLLLRAMRLFTKTKKT